MGGIRKIKRRLFLKKTTTPSGGRFWENEGVRKVFDSITIVRGNEEEVADMLFAAAYSAVVPSQEFLPPGQWDRNEPEISSPPTDNETGCIPAPEQWLFLRSLGPKAEIMGKFLGAGVREYRAFIFSTPKGTLSLVESSHTENGLYVFNQIIPRGLPRGFLQEGKFENRRFSSHELAGIMSIWKKIDIFTKDTTKLYFYTI